MKLKEIPQDTIVHTPTEDEARELLAILSENGYICNDGKPLSYDELSSTYYNVNTTWCAMGKKRVCCTDPTVRKSETILSLAAFKERYCEEENLQPKFRVGDKVVWGDCAIYTIEEVNTTYKIRDSNGLSYSYAKECSLSSYTEPKTKPTEDMETKELNLCELLAGHEGEVFYTPYLGACKLDAIEPDEDHPIRVKTDDGMWVSLQSCGHEPYGVDMLFPDRESYEQSPFDATEAWMKWQEEQKKFGLDIKIETYFEGKFGWEDCDDDVSCLHFRTAADRDKCIAEIKTIIEKYK